MLPNWYRKARAYAYCNLTPGVLYSRFKCGIRNLVTWFPVIWRDRDWDAYFLFAVMHKKLKKMEHLHRHYGVCVDAEKYANQMRTCRLLIKRLMEDDYHRNTPEQDESWEKLDDLISYLNRPMTRSQSKAIMEETKREGQMIEQDLDLLFKTMRKHIRKWWD